MLLDGGAVILPEDVIYRASVFLFLHNNSLLPRIEAQGFLVLLAQIVDQALKFFLSLLK